MTSPAPAGGKRLPALRKQESVVLDAGLSHTHKLEVNLKVTSNDDLAAAVAAIEHEIKESSEVDVGLAKFHLSHIAEQLKMETANELEHRRISLEHLEL